MDSVDTDSDSAVGAVLEQLASGIWQPLAFFSRTLCDPERKYSVFNRELLALNLAHFHFFLEDRGFTTYVDHKPLTFAMSKISDPWSALQQCQLAAISEFTSTWLVSPTGLLTVCPTCWLTWTSSHFVPRRQASCRRTCRCVRVVCVCCAMFLRVARDRSFPFRVFDSVHSLSHPSVRTSVKLVSARFVWPGLRKLMKDCVFHANVQRFHRHTQAPLEPFRVLGRRFDHVHVNLVGPLPQSQGFAHLLTVVDRTTRWLEEEAILFRAPCTTACLTLLFQNRWTPLSLFLSGTMLINPSCVRFTMAHIELLNRATSTLFWTSVVGRR